MIEIKKSGKRKFIPYQKQGQHRTIHNIVLFCKLVGISCTGIVSAYSGNAVLTGTITVVVWSLCEIIDAEFAKHNEGKYHQIIEEMKKSKLGKQPLR